MWDGPLQCLLPLPVGGGATEVDLTDLADGDVTVEIEVRDTGSPVMTGSVSRAFTVDTVAPDAVGNLQSTSHTEGQWSSTSQVDVTWQTAADATSGLSGYSTLWSQDPEAVPSTLQNAGSEVTSASRDFGRDGPWYFTIRARDSAGNWTLDADVQRIGPFNIDTASPVVSAQIEGSMLTLTGDDGEGSGVSVIKYRLDGGDWQEYPGQPVDMGETMQAEFHAVDKAGNTGSIDTAVRAHAIMISQQAGGDVESVASEGTVSCSVGAADTHGHDVIYQWTAEDGSGNEAGSFDDATSASPTWTAPANTSQVIVDYTINVTVTCSQNSDVNETSSFTLSVEPVHEITVTTQAAADPETVDSEGSATCSVAAEDSLGHALTYAWTATDGTGDPAGSFDDSASATPTWTAPANNGQSAEQYDVNVTITCSEDASLEATSTFTIEVMPLHEIEISEAAAGSPESVASEGSVDCSVTAADSLGHDVTYAWTATDRA